MIKLPKGYKAIKDRVVGITYVDENGKIVFQHPFDTDVARIGVWQIAKKRGREGNSEKRN